MGHTYNQFVIRVRNKRDELKGFLNARDVGCEIYYPLPLHMQECFGSMGHRPEDFPVSVEAAEKTLALPIFPELRPEQIGYVVETIAEYLTEPSVDHFSGKS